MRTTNDTANKYYRFDTRGHPVMGDDPVQERLQEDREKYAQAGSSDLIPFRRVVEWRQEYVDYYTALVSQGVRFRRQPAIAAQLRRMEGQ